MAEQHVHVQAEPFVGSSSTVGLPGVSATMAAPVPAPEKHHTQCTVSPVPAAAGASDKNETSDDDVVFVDEVVREVIDLT